MGFGDIQIGITPWFEDIFPTLGLSFQICKIGI